MLFHRRAGAGEPLVLLHPLGSSQAAWDPVFDDLSQDFDVIALDLPGFGRSADVSGEQTISGFADQVERFFVESGVHRPHVAGNSLGGGIALELGRRGAVRSVTAVSPIGFWSGAERTYCRLLLKAMRAGLPLVRGPLPRWMEHRSLRVLLFGVIYGKPWRADSRECLQDVDSILGSSGFDQAIAAMGGYAAPDQQEIVDTPVTILWGSRDLVLPVWQSWRAGRRLPNARVRRLGGCGHVPFRDDPARAAELMRAACRE
ncbi:alpha/beta fold hydrolase [Gordonia sp. NPDC003376]